jgi:hypothetical protein
MKTYAVLRNDCEVGVFTRRQLKKKIISGQIVSTDQMCQSGTTQWFNIGNVDKLSSLFNESDKEEQSFSINPDSVDIDEEDVKSSIDKNYDSLLDAEPVKLEPLVENAEPPLDTFQKKDQEVARSELVQATLFATRNYLRRSIFIHHAEKVIKFGYIFQFIGLIIFGMFTYLVSMQIESSAQMVPVIFGWIVALIIGVAVTALCVDAGNRLNASIVVGVNENSTLELLGLVIITIGIAIFTGLLLVSFTASSYWSVLYGALILLAAVLAAGLVLSPSITNVDFRKMSSAEEIAGLFLLIPKVLVLLCPFIFACCSAIGVIRGVVLTYALWTRSEEIQLTMGLWAEPGAFFVLGSFFPLVAYIVLFSTDMFTRLFRN